MELSDDEIAELKREHRKCRERRLADRIKAVLLLAKGLSCQEVGEILLLDDDTVRRHARLYALHGVRGLLSEGHRGREPMLSPGQLRELDAHLGETVYPGVAGIIDWVRSRFALEYSRSGMAALLKRMGYVYKCPKVLPSKGDPEAQRRFVEQYRELEKDLGEADHIYFMDGVHPLHNSVAAHGRFKKGRPAHLPSNTGRNRINLNGAIDLAARTVSVVECERINAQAVVAHLEGILEGQKDGKAYFMADNARYYRSKVVRAFLEREKRAEIVFLPPYSPNLNIIERLWLIMKKEVVHNRYYEKFGEFRENILGFFENETWKKPCYEKILTDNFHIVEPEFSGFKLA
jgi:transposase